MDAHALLKQRVDSLETLVKEFNPNDSSSIDKMRAALTEADTLLEDAHLKRGSDERDIALYSLAHGVRLQIQRILACLDVRALQAQHVRRTDPPINP